MYSWLERLVSLRHGFWFGVSQRVGWSRGVFRETPAGDICNIYSHPPESIDLLRAVYQVRFETQLAAATSRNNYEYLQILDQGWSAAGLPRPEGGGTLCDVGCASFWYAAALQAFFRPQRLLGIEVEGHRLFRDGRSRIDYARGYLAPFSDAAFVIADYTRCEQPADLVTAWFPFLTARAILAWRLPLSLLTPDRMIARIRHNLRPGGLFFMVNHGPEEAARARELCVAAGFVPIATTPAFGDLSRHRSQTPVLSWWR